MSTQHPPFRKGLRIVAGIVAASAFALPSAQAQTNAFSGGTSNPGIWNDAANWALGALPSGVNQITDIGVDSAIVGVPAGALLNATANLSTSQTIGELRIGRGNNAIGEVNHTTGTLTTGGGGWTFIGVDGDGANPSTGTYNLSGDAIFSNTAGDGPVLVGSGGGPHAVGNENVGTVTVAGTAQFTAGAMAVGHNSGNIGILNQSGGSVTVNNWMNIADDDGAVGTYTMTGGSLSFGELSVGQKNGAVGTLSVSGSSVVTGGNLRFGRENGGTGTLNITGSGITFTPGQLSLASNDGGFSDASGTLNFFSDAFGLSALGVTGNVTLNNGLGATTGIANLGIDLSGGDPGGNLLLVDVGGTLVGEFTGLAEGAVVPGSNGRTITYLGGDGNDIFLVPEPSAVALVIMGTLICLVARRKRR